MRNKKLVICSGLIGVLFVLTTVWGAFYKNISGFSDFCYVFHLVPFGLSYTEGVSIWVYLYYIILWFLISLVIHFFINSYFYKKK